MRRLALLVVTMMSLAACAATEPDTAPALPEVRDRHLHDSEPDPATRAPAAIDERPRFQGFARSYQGEVSLAALAEHGLEIYETPGAAEPFLVLPETTIVGTTTVVAVIGAPEDGWARVMLPVRPNGTTGWVRTDEVDLFVVSGRIVVDLSDRTLTYFQNDVEMLSTVVAVGAERSPTPTGHFFVTDSVTLTKPGTAWGPHALGLSARSEHITEFNGGDGIIGIHGTSRPSSIGEAASFGCVRLHNEAITRLHALVPLGTPVEIRA